MKTVTIISVLCLLLAAASCQALETSMVLRHAGAGLAGTYIVVEPNLGTITVYAVEGNNLTRHGSANFVGDVELRSETVVAEKGKHVYSQLRMGSDSNVPSSTELIQSYSDTPTPAETALKLKAYRARVIEAEDDFWLEDHPYDGVVRGALGSTSLLLCVPSMHAILIYDIQDLTKDPILKAYRNYGPEMYMQQGMSTAPAPAELLQHSETLSAQARKALAKQMKEVAEKGGSLALKPSDPWVGVDAADRFVLVDPANMHIATYEYDGRNLALCSVRNLEIEMLMTGFSTGPNEIAELGEYVQSRRPQLLQAGIQPDAAYFKTLVREKQVSNGKISDLQANIAGDDLMLDFLGVHKLFVYKLLGAGNGLELTSMRDYTIDIGLQLQDREFWQPVNAKLAWQAARDDVASHNLPRAMRLVKIACTIYPCIYTDIEKDPRSKDLKKNPDWQPIIDAAIKGCDDWKKVHADRLKKAQEERDREKEEANAK